MGGQHLTWENRIAIESLLKAKVSASQIAAVVGCSKRTVYREIQRGQCEQLNGTTYEMYTIYSAQKAQNRADQMTDLHKGRPVKLCPELAAYLEDYIGSRHYSPAAASREILLQGLALPQISANTVYRYIYRGYLRLCGLDLPVGRYNVKQKQGELRPAKAHRNDRSIDERPPEVETREDVGFWEMDTVVGTSAGPSRCLLVLTERKTRFEIVRVLESKTAREVLRVLRELRQEFGEDFLAFRISHVQRDGFLVGIELKEVQGVRAIHVVHFITCRISALHLLHLDDVGAHPCEHLRARRAGLHLRPVNHGDAFQRRGVLRFLCCRIVRCAVLHCGVLRRVVRVRLIHIMHCLVLLISGDMWLARST